MTIKSKNKKFEKEMVEHSKKLKKDLWYKEKEDGTKSNNNQN